MASAQRDRRGGEAETKPEAAHARGSAAADRALSLAEGVVYLVVAVVLLAAAALLVGSAAYRMATHLGDGVESATREALDTLLLVFVFVELLGAVRATVRQRRLVAEPFLLAGIIAAIKEIVVVAGAEEVRTAGGEEFRNAMVEVGVLGGIVLVLAAATLILRRKEREPEEVED